jgi:hypothetical protein
MSTANVNKVIRLHGRLSVGGTNIGMCGGLEFHVGRAWYEIRDEAKGGQIHQIIQGDQECSITGFIRDYDADARALFSALLFHTSTGTGARAGTALSGVVVLFTPRAVGIDPYIKLYNAVPLIGQGESMPMSAGRDATIPFEFKALPDSGGKLAEWGISVT